VAKSKEGVLPDFVDGIDRVLKDVQPPSLEIHDGGWVLAGGLPHDALIWRPLALGVVGVDHTGRGDPDEFQFGVQNGGRIELTSHAGSKRLLENPAMAVAVPLVGRQRQPHVLPHVPAIVLVLAPSDGVRGNYLGGFSV
jgi:hypothetical protein